MSDKFSRWLARAVEEKGLSQRAISQYAGLSPSTVNLLIKHPDRIDTYRDQLSAADTDFALRRAIVEALDVRARLGFDDDTRAVKPYFA